MRQEKEFNEYYEAFKKLEPKEKFEIINDELKDLLVYLTKLNRTLNLDDRILINKEIINIEQSKDNMDDFVNSVFIYVHSIEESLATYMEAIYKIIYKESEDEK